MRKPPGKLKAETQNFIMMHKRGGFLKGVERGKKRLTRGRTEGVVELQTSELGGAFGGGGQGKKGWGGPISRGLNLGEQRVNCG